MAKKLQLHGTFPTTPGPTPKLSVGTVTSLEPGSTPTVEITGTDEAPVLNFGIPTSSPDSGENPSGGGLSTTAVNLLIEILESAVYNANMTGKIESLKEALGYSGGDTPGDPDEPVVTDDITVSDGVMTIISVGSEITVSGGVMTIA